MFKTFAIALLMITTVGISSCSVAPQGISFGEDQCDYCKMNIVDPMHAAQYVTLKGKQFRFDAIECMIAQLKEIDETELATILVSDYGNEEEMTDAQKATYLISKNIKSPMGAFLSAFAEESKALKAQQEYTGELYDWNGIKAELAD